jgi:hypothetical protein
MPQWDFLDFLAERAKRYPCFRLLISTEVDGLIEAEGRVVLRRALFVRRIGNAACFRGG